MPLKAVVIDNDGCIVPTGLGEMPEGFYEGAQKLWETLGELEERGILAGICTGRDRNYVEHGAFWLGLRLGWCVIESGAALFHPVTKEFRLNPALTPEVLEAFAGLRGKWVPDILKEFPELFLYPGNQIQLTFERKHGVKAPIGSFYDRIKERLGYLEDHRLVKIHHSNIAVDISPMGSDGTPLDKAWGVRFLGDVVGIQPAEMLGIGDSEGDFPMLATVGLVGCPSNASQQCKDLVEQRGGHVSSLRYSQGVADVIRHFLKT